MARKLETIFKEEVIHALRQLSRVWMVKIQQVAIRGTPDILACVNGYFVAIELKTDAGKLDALQKYNLTQIQKAGGVGLVLCPENYDEVLDVIEAISRGEPMQFPDPENYPEPLAN